MARLNFSKLRENGKIEFFKIMYFLEKMARLKFLRTIFISSSPFTLTEPVVLGVIIRGLTMEIDLKVLIITVLKVIDTTKRLATS